MGYAELRKQVEEQAATGRGDIEKSIEEALASLTTKTQEAMGYVTELEKSNAPTAWVDTFKGTLDKTAADIVNSIKDLDQRGGLRGSSGLGTILDTYLNSLTPQVAALTQKGMEVKNTLGLQKTGLTERLGVNMAGLQESKGKSLADVGTKSASLTAQIGTQEAAELAAIEAKKLELQNALAIAGKLTSKSTTDVSKNLGVDFDLSKILNQPNASGGTGGTTGGTGGSGLTQAIAQLEALKKMQWTPGTPMQIQNADQVPLYFAGQQRNQLYSNLMGKLGQNIGRI